MTTTVRFAYYLHIDSRYESLSAYAHEEWFDLAYSYKVGQRQIITADGTV